jgi:hypothetical protein
VVFTAALSSSGSITKVPRVLVGGTLSLAGSLRKVAAKVLGAALSVAGTLMNTVIGGDEITPDPHLTLFAVDRNEALFPMQGFAGAETLRALDRNEALKPLEAING